MSGNSLQLSRLLWRVCVLLVAATALAGCGTVISPWLPETSVAPLPGDDLIAPCTYAMRLASSPPVIPGGTPPFVSQNGVLVIFDRADSSDLFNDADVQSMASQLKLATVFAYQCNKKYAADLNPDSATGPGRALFQSLNQFATLTGHPELADAKVVLYGFSAAGILSVSIAYGYPDRVIGAIPYASGSAYYDLDTVPVSPQSARVPMLILANGQDPASGTSRSYRLFQRGWALGAPWGFGVQPGQGHCCNITTKPLVIPWVTAVAQRLEPMPNTQLAVASTAAPVSPTVRFQCSPDGTVDSYGQNDCKFSSASLLPSATGGPDPAWLPDSATANAWLNWVLNPGKN